MLSRNLSEKRARICSNIHRRNIIIILTIKSERPAMKTITVHTTERFIRVKTELNFRAIERTKSCETKCCFTERGKHFNGEFNDLHKWKYISVRPLQLHVVLVCELQFANSVPVFCSDSSNNKVGKSTKSEFSC